MIPITARTASSSSSSAAAGAAACTRKRHVKRYSTKSVEMFFWIMILVIVNLNELYFFNPKKMKKCTQRKHNQRTTPTEWRQWLASWTSRNSTSSAIQMIDNVRFPSGPPSMEVCCGVTMIIDLINNSNSNSKSTTNTTKTFFKIQVGDNPFHREFESHLREIMASYLDQVLGTNITMPCVGFQLKGDDILYYEKVMEQPKRPDQSVYNKTLDYTSCVHNNTNLTTTTTNFDGALMLWADGVGTVERDQIAEWALKNVTTYYNSDTKKKIKTRSTTTTTTITTTTTTTNILPSEIDQNRRFQIIHNSAVRYAIFNFIGGCMKSGHNHFALFPIQDDHANDDDDNNNKCDDHYHLYNAKLPLSFLSIDNDRCLVPRQVFKNPKLEEKYSSRFSFWENTVLEQIHCRDFPLDLVHTIQTAAETSNPNEKISVRLREEVKKDILSEQLLSFQPEAILQIERRVQQLAKRLKKCNFEQY